MCNRNWTIVTLVILLAVCFTFYAGHCYSSQRPDDLYPGPIYDPWPGPIYDPSPLPYPDPFPFPYPSPFPLPDPWQGPFYEWPLIEIRQPAGLTTSELMQEQFPGFDRFYNLSDIPGHGLGYDNYGLPATNWNPYQQPDLYVLPGSLKHTLFEFTQQQPDQGKRQQREPDIWMPSVMPLPDMWMSMRMPDMWMGFSSSSISAVGNFTGASWISGFNAGAINSY